MRVEISLNMTKLLAVLLVVMPFVLAIEMSQSSELRHQIPRMMRSQRRSVASWLTHISSKASDWVFGSVPNPVSDPKSIPKSEVSGVAVLPQMPYPYATGMIPRLASETLSGNGLPGGWMCTHVSPPAGEDEDDYDDDGRAGVGARGLQPGSQGGAAGGLGGGAGGGLAGGAGIFGGGFGGGTGVGVGTGPGGGGNGHGYAGAAGAGGGAGYGGVPGAGGGYVGGLQGSGNGGGVGTGVGPDVGGGMESGLGAGAGMGGGVGAGNDMGLGAGGGGAGGFVGGGGTAVGTGVGAGLGAGASTGLGGAGTPNPQVGYIRYNGQLMTIDQYQQALAAASSGGTPSPAGLSRRDIYQPDTSAVFLNTFKHKRQAAESSSPGGNADEGAEAKNRKQPAKVLMCINGDPAVPPIKFDTMSGLRIRDPAAQQDGVVEITNLPNYQMPWMAFLPTADMWNEQQQLMIAQEKVIENNMTTGPPPQR
ncbi:hypothetical protein EX895_004778 [Sporisorium graminicola]|uniref:Uncharacterized protein n=1 Tax=Sporisorium graminicola TaxID=280036 RepID=A0A4U7KP26_9BASI|nr:hypothetical protein EX895_004778 [Sporisorium graminicola]TKY85953.1 hypothetical protein EX895_004778 [Sporisorium graminicola]